MDRDDYTKEQLHTLEYYAYDTEEKKREEERKRKDENFGAERYHSGLASFLSPNQEGKFDFKGRRAGVVLPDVLYEPFHNGYINYDEDEAGVLSLVSPASTRCIIKEDMLSSHLLTAADLDDNLYKERIKEVLTISEEEYKAKLEALPDDAVGIRPFEYFSLDMGDVNIVNTYATNREEMNTLRRRKSIYANAPLLHPHQNYPDPVDVNILTLRNRRTKKDLAVTEAVFYPGGWLPGTSGVSLSKGGILLMWGKDDNSTEFIKSQMPVDTGDIEFRGITKAGKDILQTGINMLVNIITDGPYIMFHIVAINPFIAMHTSANVLIEALGTADVNLNDTIAIHPKSKDIKKLLSIETLSFLPFIQSIWSRQAYPYPGKVIQVKGTRYASVVEPSFTPGFIPSHIRKISVLLQYHIGAILEKPMSQMNNADYLIHTMIRLNVLPIIMIATYMKTGKFEDDIMPGLNAELGADVVLSLNRFNRMMNHMRESNAKRAASPNKALRKPLYLTEEHVIALLYDLSVCHPLLSPHSTESANHGVAYLQRLLEKFRD